MNQWPYEVTTLQFGEIMEAVKNERWQTFRLSLKGLSTSDKLEKLKAYMRNSRYEDKGSLSRVEQVRIDNYINALLRGGQLVRRDDGIYVQR
jgi:hypothetical protein